VTPAPSVVRARVSHRRTRPFSYAFEHRTTRENVAIFDQTGFGKLIKGEEVLDAIAQTPVTSSRSGERSKPTKRIDVESVKIVPADSIK